MLYDIYQNFMYYLRQHLEMIIGIAIIRYVFETQWKYLNYVNSAIFLQSKILNFVGRRTWILSSI